MSFTVIPVRKLRGVVELPPSKSYSIRAFFIAACGGVSRVLGASDCDDARAALDVAVALGVRVSPVKGGLLLEAPAFQKKKEKLFIDVRESGTSLRFILPLLPHYAGEAIVSGKGTLVGRPNRHLCEALRARGLRIKGNGRGESVPVTFRGGEVPCGEVKVDGSVSSQFISALMIAAPLADRGDTRLVMTGKDLVSRDYVLMTRQILAKAGICVEPRGARAFFIPGGQAYRGLKAFHVPSDYGLAAFFMAGAALVPSDVRLKGYFDDTLVQSDGAIFSLLEKMGVCMNRSSRSIHVKGDFQLKGGTFSLKNCPDLVPVMAVMAMFARGVTRLTGIGHARVKESDRISDLRKELIKVGADITEKPDEIIIRPRGVYGEEGVVPVLDPHHDHRLAMAFAVLGLRTPVSIRDMECTTKSYPGFVKAFTTLIAA
ncbi:MAG: 3-phosphoshikimate 1-carboxyvinyltransferase [Candidatus Omnitrophota bacterium]